MKSYHILYRKEQHLSEFGAGSSVDIKALSFELKDGFFVFDTGDVDPVFINSSCVQKVEMSYEYLNLEGEG